MLHALLWSMSEIGILSSCIKSSFKWNLVFAAVCHLHIKWKKEKTACEELSKWKKMSYLIQHTKSKYTQSCTSCIAILFPGSYVSSIISTAFVSNSAIHFIIWVYVNVVFIGKKEMALVSLICLFNFFAAAQLWFEMKWRWPGPFHSIWFSIERWERHSLPEPIFETHSRTMVHLHNRDWAHCGK